MGGIAKDQDLIPALCMLLDDAMHLRNDWASSIQKLEILCGDLLSDRFARAVGSDGGYAVLRDGLHFRDDANTVLL